MINPMKDQMARFGPLLVAGILGWLIARPPQVLAIDSYLSAVILVVAVFALVLGGFMVLINANLPADIRLEAALDADVSELQGLISAYRSLGFVAGPTIKVLISPPVILVPLFHENGEAYGTVFRTTGTPSKISWDFNSVFEGDRGGLTSSPHAESASLPAAPGSFRQVLVDVDVPALYARHRSALSFLEQLGLRTRPATPEELVPDFKRSIARQRESFFRAPVRNTVLVVFRAITKQVPERGPLQTQDGVEARVRDLLAGPGGG